MTTGRTVFINKILAWKHSSNLLKIQAGCTRNQDPITKMINRWSLSRKTIPLTERSQNRRSRSGHSSCGSWTQHEVRIIKKTIPEYLSLLTTTSTGTCSTTGNCRIKNSNRFSEIVWRKLSHLYQSSYENSVVNWLGCALLKLQIKEVMGGGGGGPALLITANWSVAPPLKASSNSHLGGSL